jgi:hypothetical protein
MEKISLYAISDAIIKVEDFIEDENELAEYLDSLKIDFSEKVSQVLMYRRGLELTQEALGSEIDRLAQLKKYYERKSENLKNYVSSSMQKIGKDNLELEIAKLSFRKSESIEVTNIAELSPEFITVKTTESADKTAIKKAIKEGKEVTGAELITKLNLQIK